MKNSFCIFLIIAFIIPSVIEAKNDVKKPIEQTFTELSIKLTNLSHKINKECSDEKYKQNKTTCLNLSGKFKYTQIKLDKLTSSLNDFEVLNLADLSCQKSDKDLEIDSLTMSAQKISNKALCSNKVKKENSKRCFKDMMCVMASTISFASIFKSKKGNNCVNSENNCILEVLKGVIKSLKSALTSVWDLLKFGYKQVKKAGKWIKDKAGDFWRWVSRAEDESSDKAMLITTLSDSDIKEIEKDGGESWLKKIWKAIAKSFDDFIKKDVFCQKWSGVSHFSKCEKPMSDWDCLSCAKKTQGFCMAAGFLVPEISALIFSGGISSFVKGGVKGALLATKGTKAVARLSKLAAKTSKNPILQKLKSAATKGNALKAKAISKASPVFKTINKGVLWLQRQPYVAKANNIVKKIKNRVDNTSIVKSFKKFQNKGNRTLKIQGNRLEAKGQHYFEKSTSKTALKKLKNAPYSNKIAPGLKGASNSPLKTKRMDPKYYGEENGAFFGTKVERFTPEMRKKIKVYVDKDGKLVNYAGKPWNAENGIYTMDRSGNIYYFEYPVSGKVHHSSLSNGLPVSAAGHMRIENGVLKSLNDISGHYRPEAMHFEQILNELKKRGADLSTTERRSVTHPSFMEWMYE